MIFNRDDKVMVNLGAKGTHSGTVQYSDNDKRIRVQLDNGDTVLVDPWDVIWDDDPQEYKERLALAIDADIIREQEMNGE